MNKITAKIENSYEGCVHLLFEIFGLTGWDKYSDEKAIKIKTSKSGKKHWWTGIKRKPKFYKSYRKKIK